MGDGKARVLSFRDLRVWQEAVSLAESVYKVTREFPREEIYGLTSQMRRAAVSVASNIAEGNARQSRGEYLQFLGNARGSLAELYTQTILSARLQLIDQATETKLLTEIDNVGRLLNALRSSIAKRPAKQFPSDSNP